MIRKYDQAESSRLDDVKQIFFGHNDDSYFYKIVIPSVFNDFEPFTVRDDIKTPQKNEDTIISFDDGRIGYFKIQKTELTDDEFNSILDDCCYLQDKFGGIIDSYILCRPEIELKEYNGNKKDNIKITVKSLKNCDGDKIVEILEDKRKNKEQFTYVDHICHILLPYMGYKNREEFLPKYQHYLMETMLDNAEKQGIEVIR